MEEHPHRKLIVLIIALIIAVIIGFIYYFSVPNKQYIPETYRQLAPKTQQDVLNSLQSSTTKTSLNSPAKEAAILKTLQSK